MKHYRYQAFGLTIKSDMRLPMLRPAQKYAKATVRISQAELDPAGLESPVDSKLHFQAVPGRLWIRIPSVGLFEVLNGSEIKYDPSAGSDQATIALFILGTCMGNLLLQKGLIVFRAMAVQFGDKAVVFASSSGQGKSFLAAAFHQNGYKIITDDVCVINEKDMVIPGYPVIKLWRDCFTALDIKPGELSKVRPQVEKYAYPVGNGFCNDSLPIEALYVLNTWNKDQPEFQTITGMRKFTILGSQTYGLKYLIGQSLKNDNARRLMRLAGRVSLRSLSRPQSYKVAKWIELIESDIEEARSNNG